MVAGTLVVRDREVDSPHWGESASRTFTAPALIAGSPSLLRWVAGDRAGSVRRVLWGGPPHLRVVLPAPALAKLSASDLEVLEGFFARRLDMDLATRAALADAHRLGSLRQVGSHDSAGHERGNISRSRRAPVPRAGPDELTGRDLAVGLRLTESIRALGHNAEFRGYIKILLGLRWRLSGILRTPKQFFKDQPGFAADWPRRQWDTRRARTWPRA